GMLIQREFLIGDLLESRLSGSKTFFERVLGSFALHDLGSYRARSLFYPLFQLFVERVNSLPCSCADVNLAIDGKPGCRQESRPHEHTDKKSNVGPAPSRVGCLGTAIQELRLLKPHVRGGGSYCVDKLLSLQHLRRSGMCPESPAMVDQLFCELKGSLYLRLDSVQSALLIGILCCQTAQ